MAYGIHSDVAQDQFGNALANASVTVYSVVAGVVQVNPLATIYTAVSSITATPLQQANPMTTDPLGRYAFGAPDGFYAIDISGSNFPTYRVYKNLVTTYLPGAGGVANVALALPSQFAISGSPVTGTGTLTGAWNNQNANLVFAGPNTGGAAAPTFRALIAADLPSSGISAAIYGAFSPTTGVGNFPVIQLDIYGRAIGAANVAFTIPVFSAQGTWTKAQNVASVALIFGAPLVTDATLGNAFHTTATASFVFQNPTGLVSGGTYLWRIQQDGVGSRLISSYGTMFKFPGGTPGVLSTPAGSVDLLTAYFDGTNLLCTLSKAYA
jgi:hypothetical protein